MAHAVPWQWKTMRARIPVPWQCLLTKQKSLGGEFHVQPTSTAREQTAGTFFGLFFSNPHRSAASALQRNEVKGYRIAFGASLGHPKAKISATQIGCSTLEMLPQALVFGASEPSAMPLFKANGGKSGSTLMILATQCAQGGHLLESHGFCLATAALHRLGQPMLSKRGFERN